MATRPIEDDRRPRQKYYFEGATSTAPKKNTLAWVVDRIQWRETVRNAFRWLIVSSRGNQPTLVVEFFAIHIERFGGDGQR
jgi:hypothetical protein